MSQKSSAPRNPSKRGDFEGRRYQRGTRTNCISGVNPLITPTIFNMNTTNAFIPLSGNNASKTQPPVFGFSMVPIGVPIPSFAAPITQFATTTPKNDAGTKTDTRRRFSQLTKCEVPKTNHPLSPSPSVNSDDDKIYLDSDLEGPDAISVEEFLETMKHNSGRLEYLPEFLVVATQNSVKVYHLDEVTWRGDHWVTLSPQDVVFWRTTMESAGYLVNVATWGLLKRCIFRKAGATMTKTLDSPPRDDEGDSSEKKKAGGPKDESESEEDGPGDPYFGFKIAKTHYSGAKKIDLTFGADRTSATPSEPTGAGSVASVTTYSAKVQLSTTPDAKNSYTSSGDMLPPLPGAQMLSEPTMPVLMKSTTILSRAILPARGRRGKRQPPTNDSMEIREEKLKPPLSSSSSVTHTAPAEHILPCILMELPVPRHVLFQTIASMKASSQSNSIEFYIREGPLGEFEFCEYNRNRHPASDFTKLPLAKRSKMLQEMKDRRWIPQDTPEIFLSSFHVGLPAQVGLGLPSVSVESFEKRVGSFGPSSPAPKFLITITKEDTKIFEYRDITPLGMSWSEFSPSQKFYWQLMMGSNLFEVPSDVEDKFFASSIFIETVVSQESESSAAITNEVSTAMNQSPRPTQPEPIKVAPVPEESINANNQEKSRFKTCDSTLTINYPDYPPSLSNSINFQVSQTPVSSVSTILPGVLADRHRKQSSSNVLNSMPQSSASIPTQGSQNFGSFEGINTFAMSIPSQLQGPPSQMAPVNSAITAQQKGQNNISGLSYRSSEQQYFTPPAAIQTSIFNESPKSFVQNAVSGSSFQWADSSNSNGAITEPLPSNPFSQTIVAQPTPIMSTGVEIPLSTRASYANASEPGLLASIQMDSRMLQQPVSQASVGISEAFGASQHQMFDTIEGSYISFEQQKRINEEFDTWKYRALAAELANTQAEKEAYAMRDASEKEVRVLREEKDKTEQEVCRLKDNCSILGDQQSGVEREERKKLLGERRQFLLEQAAERKKNKKAREWLREGYEENEAVKAENLTASNKIEAESWQISHFRQAAESLRLQLQNCRKDIAQKIDSESRKDANCLDLREQVQVLQMDKKNLEATIGETHVELSSKMTTIQELQARNNRDDITIKELQKTVSGNEPEKKVLLQEKGELQVWLDASRESVKHHRQKTFQAELRLDQQWTKTKELKKDLENANKSHETKVKKVIREHDKKICQIERALKESRQYTREIIEQKDSVIDFLDERISRLKESSANVIGPQMSSVEKPKDTIQANVMVSDPSMPRFERWLNIFAVFISWLHWLLCSFCFYWLICEILDGFSTIRAIAAVFSSGLSSGVLAMVSLPSFPYNSLLCSSIESISLTSRLSATVSLFGLPTIVCNTTTFIHTNRDITLSHYNGYDLDRTNVHRTAVLEATNIGLLPIYYFDDLSVLKPHVTISPQEIYQGVTRGYLSPYLPFEEISSLPASQVDQPAPQPISSSMDRGKFWTWVGVCVGCGGYVAWHHHCIGGNWAIF